ncbi:AAA family ATPase [Eoetvoesiella caeni]|uniref:ATPase family protein associated with various cellular activities (AAA) n=1 Tax=Eoetvoesiella caeni TaxID=645616 RepID=A0A366GXU9_9BURK|nr:AAA family ATPase [Eoetvoesiella caeni]MCI2811343.1 AAA family ATPase [Eoetvoesiella caeni]NYT57228.1 AAA family ATPase [Eoetvoesiella caeni]RBP33575.1 ATPase family protein associated with various cellular activities (AAA) [Eoetvoesiella caeni]
MNHNDYTNALAQAVDADAGEDILDGARRAAELPAVPLRNFFGDELLTLLYRSTEPCARPLAEMKRCLVLVCDPKEARHVRAAAAVALGRFVQARRPEGDEYVLGSSNPQDWFQLARQLNSVVGALALANTLLAQRGQKVEFNLEVDPLPRLAESGERTFRMPPVVSHDIAQAWYLGARVALRHVQRNFCGWDREAFGCALACVVNYLTLLPGKHMSAYVSPLVQRREALAWIKPLWNRLIEAAAQQVGDAEAYRSALIEQQLAVFLRLDDLEKNPEPPRVKPEPAPVKTAAQPDPNQVVIVPGVIPTSSDRAESEYLKQFESLRQPMVCSTFPSLAKLYGLRATLSGEFPWAEEAISVVMSDLIARRRHGVMRLGMAPVLLVGLPGTGKTRFAQRLSDLLGTPNTVINLAGMTDVKLLKGVTRGWASNRPSRMVEFMQQTKVANPLFILDEIDKARAMYSNGGDPQEALLDLLEPGNARRYQDIYLMTECDLSHCLYVATSNSLSALPKPLLSRLRPVFFPTPGLEHTEVIVKGVLRDMERSWDLPPGGLTLTPRQVVLVRGLAPREMRRAVLELLGRDADEVLYTVH